MIPLFILALAATALVFLAIPVVLFALMLETCDARRRRAPKESFGRVRESGEALAEALAAG
jgi:hypothetical protein